MSSTSFKFGELLARLREPVLNKLEKIEDMEKETDRILKSPEKTTLKPYRKVKEKFLKFSDFVKNICKTEPLFENKVKRIKRLLINVQSFIDFEPTVAILLKYNSV